MQLVDRTRECRRDGWERWVRTNALLASRRKVVDTLFSSGFNASELRASTLGAQYEGPSRARSWTAVVGATLAELQKWIQNRIRDAVLLGTWIRLQFWALRAVRRTALWQPKSVFDSRHGQLFFGGHRNG